MPRPVTEIVNITLKGSDLKAPDAAKIWNDTLKTLSQQKGVQKYYWGVQHEKKDVVILAVDWDQISSHEAFIASPGYAPFVAHLSQITKSIHFHHTTSTPSPPTLLTTAPCIELATFYSIQDGFLDNLEKFVGAFKGKEVKGFHGAVIYEVVEEIAKGGGTVGKGNAGGLWIGWDSVEAHLKFRETELFSQNIGLLREKQGGVEMFHVSFKGSV